MKTYCLVKADTNDADYVEKITLIDNDKIDLVTKIANAIKKFTPYKTNRDWKCDSNFPTNECIREDLEELSAEDYYVGKGLLTQEEFNYFNNRLCPNSEYGLHTIKNIKIFIVKEELILL